MKKVDQILLSFWALAALAIDYFKTDITVTDVGFINFVTAAIIAGVIYYLIGLAIFIITDGIFALVENIKRRLK